MITGREKEQKKLRDLYEGGRAEFVAVYGRRRVGKTYLIDEVFHSEITFRHAGLSPISIDTENTSKKSHMKDQLRHFHHSLMMHGMEESKPPESWLDAFYMLERFLMERDDKKRRLVIFLDEIQWMDTPKSGFMTGLEAFWNSWACYRHNIMLVVCGSSTSWIMDKLVNNHGGLYGRLTCEIVPKKASIHNTLITTFGLKHVEYFGDFVNTITLDDLFQSVYSSTNSICTHMIVKTMNIRLTEIHYALLNRNSLPGKRVHEILSIGSGRM